MPSSAAALTVRRTASAPRLWPAIRGRPRDLAQRPLPSMMMATWVGGLGVSGLAASAFAGNTSIGSDLKDLLFVLRQGIVDLLDVLVRRLLHLFAAPAMVVLGDLAVLLHLLQRLHPVAPDVAHRYPPLLGIFVSELGQLLAPLAAELGDGHAHKLPVALGIDAQIGVPDRLFHRDDQAPVPDLDRDHARL